MKFYPEIRIYITPMHWKMCWGFLYQFLLSVLGDWKKEIGFLSQLDTGSLHIYYYIKFVNHVHIFYIFDKYSSAWSINIQERYVEISHFDDTIMNSRSSLVG